MKPKQFLLPAIIFLAIVLAALAVRMWPRTVPFEQCSDIYKQYANVEGVDATFIKDYMVSSGTDSAGKDTVIVDITVLEAKDSASWLTLKKDFEVIDPPPDIQKYIDDGEDLIYTKLISKSTTENAIPNTYPYNLLAISHLNHTLTVFHVNNND